MKSPFPGMDPFIEGCGLWGDFHYNLVYKIYETLTDRAPDRYLVRTNERSYIVLAEAAETKKHPFLPDVSIKGSKGRRRSSSKKGGGVLLAEAPVAAEPVTMRARIDDEQKEAFIEIYEAEPQLRLVTTIEVLSPSNKRSSSPCWDTYLRKRHGALLGHVNLVEIDLLRGGQRMPMIDPWPDFLYTLLVARANDSGYCRVWPVHSLRPLPSIPVPLVKPDPDLTLELQPMIDAIYERSRYARSVDYTRTLDPPLGTDEVAWLKDHLPARKRSPSAPR